MEKRAEPPRARRAWIALLFAALAAVATVALCLSCRPAAPPGAPFRQRDVAGRPIYLYSPAAIDGRRAPVLLVLHGGLGSGADFHERVPLESAADRGAFHLAYLNGTLHGREGANRRTWNAGGCCGSAQRDGVDDVAFLDEVIASLDAAGLADRERVYLLGSSNGAMMSYRFACERGRGAVRGVIGVSSVHVSGPCRNAAGVSVLMIHSRADDVVPVAGGGRGELLMGRPFPSLAESESALRAGGADVHTLLVDGGAHGAHTIDAALTAERGKGLGDTVVDLLRAP